MSVDAESGTFTGLYVEICGDVKRTESVAARVERASTLTNHCFLGHSVYQAAGSTSTE